VELLDREKCPRYSCRVIKNVNIGPSPMWLKSRLESSGIRSINNVVDVTNYVLLELGQPLHAFDYDLVEGRKIIVRAAGEESYKDLDGVERKSPETLFDGKTGRARDVMAARTEVSDGTKNILLESAYFDPSAIRKTSRKTGLKSESSYRFERGVDPNGITKALDRAAELIVELSGGQAAKGRIDEYPATIEPSLVRLSLKRVNSILGTAIDAGEITRITEGLGFEKAAASNGEITFRIPTWRVDVTREIDLIEEIARLYGYGNIPNTLPSVTMKSEGVDPAKKVQGKFKEIFVSGGFSEAINFSFEDYELLTLFGKTGALGILNPISSEGAVMRTSLLPGLIRNSVLNLNRQEQNVRLFEIGKIFIPAGKGKLPVEITKLAAAATGRRQPELWDKEEFDFFDFKNLLDKGFDALSISGSVKFRSAAEIGFLHQRIIAYMDCGFIGELTVDLSTA
jgi:phenylalanyl-tRNA synthetase beta chain